MQGKGSREQGNLVVKEAVAAMMHKWTSAFRLELAPAPYYPALPCPALSRLSFLFCLVASNRFPTLYMCSIAQQHTRVQSSNPHTTAAVVAWLA